MARKRVAVLISGRGSNMAALIDAAKEQAIRPKFAWWFPTGPMLPVSSARATPASPPPSSTTPSYGNDREAFERALQAVLEGAGIELVCLAGFMRLLTPWLVERWQGRMLNIHPSLLPAFKGLDTHARAIEAGVRIHGATVHFVVPEMDSGPIIVQGAVPVADDDTPETLAARVLAIEHKIYPQALRLLADGRVQLDGNRCQILDAGVTRGSLVVPPVET